MWWCVSFVWLAIVSFSVQICKGCNERYNQLHYHRWIWLTIVSFFVEVFIRTTYKNIWGWKVMTKKEHKASTEILIKKYLEMVMNNFVRIFEPVCSVTVSKSEFKKHCRSKWQTFFIMTTYLLLPQLQYGINRSRFSKNEYEDKLFLIIIASITWCKSNCERTFMAFI